MVRYLFYTIGDLTYQSPLVSVTSIICRPIFYLASLFYNELYVVQTSVIQTWQPYEYVVETLAPLYEDFSVELKKKNCMVQVVFVEFTEIGYRQRAG